LVDGRKRATRHRLSRHIVRYRSLAARPRAWFGGCCATSLASSRHSARSFWGAFKIWFGGVAHPVRSHRPISSRRNVGMTRGIRVSALECNLNHLHHSVLYSKLYQNRLRTRLTKTDDEPGCCGELWAPGAVALLTRTYSTERAITRHVLYLLVKKGITPALSGRPDGRSREGNTSLTARFDLFWRFKGTMTSDLSFRAAGPRSGRPPSPGYPPPPPRRPRASPCQCPDRIVREFPGPSAPPQRRVRRSYRRRRAPVAEATGPY
jgi:hypothetical protein